MLEVTTTIMLKLGYATKAYFNEVNKKDWANAPGEQLTFISLHPVALKTPQDYTVVASQIMHDMCCIYQETPPYFSRIIDVIHKVGNVVWENEPVYSWLLATAYIKEQDKGYLIRHSNAMGLVSPIYVEKIITL